MQFLSKACSNLLVLILVLLTETKEKTKAVEKG